MEEEDKKPDLHLDPLPPPDSDEDDDDEHQVGLSDDFIAEIRELLDQSYTDRIQELCRDLSAPDAAELLTKVSAAERRQLAEILEEDIPPETFSYLDHEMMNDLLESMSGAHVAAIVNELESDDALRMIDDLDEERRHEIMRHLSRKMRAAVEEGLTFPEDSAGRMMQREFVAIPQFWTVGKIVDYLRAAADALPDKFYDIFIVDPMHRFVGAVTLSSVLCAQRPVKVDTLVSEEHVTIPVDMDREQVAFQFRRKDLLSAPVVDGDNRLIGVITVDDIVDVIDEVAQEDFLKLGGVSDSDINRSAVSTAKARSSWLFINLFTAFLASFVIGMFEASIEKVVALAVLMPIVASMGGNAGTQALAVLVRALATKEVSAANAWRVVGKECLVGLLNGIAFALVLGAAVAWWYSDPKLGAVIAAAMVLNLFAAGLFGALIPVALARFGMDPAPSSGVLLTTVTDVVGFLAFLGLATFFLL
ncbi:MAG TPA: magnesium transporter [Patescibacteria group bacterium]|nr:magnesium transporter [Patescibacteria group bacterium]